VPGKDNEVQLTYEGRAVAEDEAVRIALTEVEKVLDA
jgi:hypothetical protein